jgi:hypothetical protein
MKCEYASVSVVQEGVNKKRTVLLNKKEGTTLPRSGGHEVRTGNLRVTLWNGHTLSG